MIILILAGILSALPAASVLTYDEQVDQCEAAIRQNEYGIGSNGNTALRQQCLEIEAVALRRETGSLIAQGRCPDAVALALRGGDLQLAANIRTYCSAPQR